MEIGGKEGETDESRWSVPEREGVLLPFSVSSGGGKAILDNEESLWGDKEEKPLPSFLIPELVVALAPSLRTPDSFTAGPSALLMFASSQDRARDLPLPSSVFPSPPPGCE